MGACAGKSKKQLKPREPEKQPQIEVNNNSPPQTSPISNGSVPENDNEFKGVDLDVLIIVDEQDEISRRLAQSRLVPVTDAEAELDLATLVYGHPERDYFESPLSRRFKSSDV